MQNEIEQMAVELWHKTTIREADMCDDVAEYPQHRQPTLTKH